MNLKIQQTFNDEKISWLFLAVTEQHTYLMISLRSAASASLVVASSLMLMMICEG